MMGQWAMLDSMLWGLVGFSNKIRPKVEEAGQKLAMMMKVGLRVGRYGLAPNTAMTGELKSSASVGVDSGAMVGAITSEVIGETQNMVAIFVGIPNDAGDGGYPGPVSENFWAMQAGGRVPGFWQPWYSPMSIIDVAQQFIRDKVINIPTMQGTVRKFVPGRDFISPAFDEWKLEYEDEFPNIVHKYIRSLTK